ncbi:galactosylceramidase [Massilia sp. TW-1]|uniref:galactosylceramidase n=1 Tax=Telluria antibiotica TaxID=2717319 RepID=A0ABX0PFD0_9BURK|nr:galactosylceramidase [Telluria antibiotica]NIA56107.1 galactosylceramidase [Telluria antibiotica]
MTTPKHLLLSLALFTALPAFAAAPGDVQTITLDARTPGTRFDGIGVVDGGGATSVLLKDYPEPQRSQILDLMYKPRFGASVSALIVEIPGDGNSTQGSMPSHRHTRADANYGRGYTWWVLREAKRRNPALTLDAAAWSAPGWIGDSGGNHDFFSPDGADYYVSWLKGLRDVYGLELDAIGSRNERGVSYDFAKTLRARLDAGGFAKVKLHSFDNWPDDTKFDFVKDMPKDADLRKAIDIISAHVNAPESVVPTWVREAAAGMGKPIWNTEQHVYVAGFDGALGIVQAFNRNWIDSGVTKIVNWYGIAGLYTLEPYSGVKEAAIRANWPWSGHYEINPQLWAYAHYGQFTAAGWTYLPHGSGALPAGGSYVSLKSPGRDYSVIVETRHASAPQTLRVAVGAGLAKGDVAVWRSDAHAQFVHVADLHPKGGAVALTVDPDAIYSLTTTRGQQKGSFANVPAPRAFPFPFRETFERYGDGRAWGYLPRYFADIEGAFELAPCPDAGRTCLRQTVPVRPHSWAPDWKPYTILGDDGWTDYEVSADVRMGAGESAAVMGRINDVGSGYGAIPKGYYLELDGKGEVRLVVVRGKVDKKALVGDAEQQALIKAANDAAEGGEKVLARAALGSTADGWHTLKLRFSGANIRGYVDGKPVVEATDALYGKGMAGLLAGPAQSGLSMPYYRDVVVNRVDGALPAPTAPLPGQAPLYTHTR